MKELTKWVDNVIASVNRPKFTYENMKKKRIIVAFNGAMQSGKDTAASFLVEKYGFKRVAFADALRDALYRLNPIVDKKFIHSKQGFWEWVSGEPSRIETCVTYVKDLVDVEGWESAKTRFPEVRRLLQVLGTEAGRDIHGQDCWVNIVRKQIEASPVQNFVITDLRFPNELAMVHELGGFSRRVTRKGFEPSGLHASEMFLEGVQDDITNDGTLEELEKQIDETVRFLFALKAGTV